MDQDLTSRQEARDLAKRAQEAQQILRGFTQDKLDAICRAVSEAFEAAAAELAQLACKETGFGNPEDKTVKNRFAARDVWNAIRDMKTVGILRQDREAMVWDVGVPVGVLAGIVPSTNPTSTVCYKALIALKAGCGIVFSPHPAAAECTRRACQVVSMAAESAGCPKGAVSCLTVPTMEATEELMKCPQVRLILATGGPGMVRAAYSSGKPAIGVGAGNGPAYIHGSAHVERAVEHIFRSKTFDYGTVCASEQSIVVERDMDEPVSREILRQGGYFLSDGEAEKVAGVLFRADGRLNPKVVGRPAATIAELAGIDVPRSTRVLLSRQSQVGPKSPYSWEKLCPVLAYYVEDSQDEVLKKCVAVLQHEGAGHSFMIHATDEQVVRRFALEIPVSRFMVNTPGALGGIGKSTNLFPALTLGCGAVGGSSSSNNIGPMDLINIRRVAWGKEDGGKTEQMPGKTQYNEDTIEALAAEIIRRLT